MWHTHSRLKDRDQHSILFRAAQVLGIVGSMSAIVSPAKIQSRDCLHTLNLSYLWLTIRPQGDVLFSFKKLDNIKISSCSVPAVFFTFLPISQPVNKLEVFFWFLLTIVRCL